VASATVWPAARALIAVRSQTFDSSSTRGHSRSKQAFGSPAQRWVRRQALSRHSRHILKAVQSLR
jgi:hypothetical protein